MTASPFDLLDLSWSPHLTIHNVRLVAGRADGDGAMLDVEANGHTMSVHRPFAWSAYDQDHLVGKIGYLVRPTRTADGLTRYVHRTVQFVAYEEPSLRRCSALDANGKHGWLHGSGDYVLAAPGIIPGRLGQIVEDRTRAATIAVPPEFEVLAKRFGQSPETILRAFIADAARIFNDGHFPREDGFSSSGSDERELAETYIRRAFGPPILSEYQVLEAEETKQTRLSQLEAIADSFDEYVAHGGNPDTLQQHLDELVDKTMEDDTLPNFLPVDAIGFDSSGNEPKPDVLETLVASIKESGVKDPILVAPAEGDVPWVVIDGAARLRAAKLAGLTDIPVTISINLDR